MCFQPTLSRAAVVWGTRLDSFSLQDRPPKHDRPRQICGCSVDHPPPTSSLPKKIKKKIVMLPNFCIMEARREAPKGGKTKDKYGV